MIGAGTIQAMITSLKSNRIRGGWRKPFSKRIRRKGVTVLRWKKATPQVLKEIRAKIRRQKRIENLMYTCLTISIVSIVYWVM